MSKKSTVKPSASTLKTVAKTSPTIERILRNHAAGRRAYAEVKRARLADEAKAAAKAPAAKAPGLLQRFLAHCASQSSAGYVKSLERPLGAFIDWCASRGVTRMAQVSTKTLEAYRRHAEKQGHALSTTRMALARVQTFLRFAGCQADLSVLRIQHTEAEKAHLAELAEQRAEETAEAEAPKARKSGKAA